MAAADLGRGRIVVAKNVDNEVTKFLLAKEFGWTTEQVDRQNYKDMRAITTLLFNYNSARNQEMERMAKRKK